MIIFKIVFIKNIINLIKRSENVNLNSLDVEYFVQQHSTSQINFHNTYEIGIPLSRFLKLIIPRTDQILRSNCLNRF